MYCYADRPGLAKRYVNSVESNGINGVMTDAWWVELLNYDSVMTGDLETE